MTVDCQWIEKNLEGLCDTLSLEQNRMARAHIESCDSCGKEIAALKAIDPLVKTYFQNELNRALKLRGTAGRGLPVSRVVGLGSVALVAASLLFVFALRTPPPQPAIPAASSLPESTESQPSEATPLVKHTDAPAVERAKPDASPPVRTPQIPRTPAVTGHAAPQFLVTDPAGYSRTLSDYRGRVLVIAVLNSRQTAPATNFQRLYKAFSSNSKFRFVAVSTDRQPRPAETTFPLTYNQGSTLFGAAPGEFVLLDEAGLVQSRGSLLRDFDTVFKKLQGN